MIKLNKTMIKNKKMKINFMLNLLTLTIKTKII